MMKFISWNVNGLREINFIIAFNVFSVKRNDEIYLV